MQRFCLSCNQLGAKVHRWLPRQPISIEGVVVVIKIGRPQLAFLGLGFKVQKLKNTEVTEGTEKG